jgi:DNA-binding XRE family transcriptional regulator
MTLYFPNLDREKQFIEDRVQLDEDTGCWLWTKATTSGYGYVGPKHKLAIKYGSPSVHRICYIMWKGEVADDLVVRHKCRNRHCCNPDHLEAGTHKDNAADRKRDGTEPEGSFKKGSANTKSKLTEEQVRQIKVLYEQEKLRQKDLAEFFGVGISTIAAILQGRSWSHIS